MLVTGVSPHHGTNYPVNHDAFPSGPWTGFYNYSPKDKHRMDLDLTFAGGKMSGGGNADVGAHDVSYRGFREGKGIWGTWEISLFARGGFHIWPKRVGEGETEARAK